MPKGKVWTHSRMLNYVKAQDLMLAIAGKPRGLDFVEKSLEGLDFGLPEIMDEKLLREEDGLYYLNVNFGTQEDQKLMYDICEKYGKTLTAEYEKEWGAISRVLEMHAQSQVSTEYLAYIIIGLMSLDWDGLDLTHRMGLRNTATHGE